MKTADPPTARQPLVPVRTAALMSIALAILALAELAWLAWFLIVPLPNANNIRAPLKKPGRQGPALAQGRSPRSYPIRHFP